MPENTFQVWELSSSKPLSEVDFPKASSPDAITRNLPQGLYTTFRTFGGGKRVLGLIAHLQRLYLRGEKLALPIDELRQKLRFLLQKYPKEARVRVILSEKGTFFVILEQLQPLPEEIYSTGVHVISTEIRRKTPHLKSTVFIANSSAERKKLSRSHYFEALLIHNQRILEGMSSNFFYVRNGVLCTTKRGVLAGVTRSTVLGLAKGKGIAIFYRSLKRNQIPEITEAFITSSSRGIVPVVKIDELPVGEGHPGSLTELLSDSYKEYVKCNAEII